MYLLGIKSTRKTKPLKQRKFKSIKSAKKSPAKKSPAKQVKVVKKKCSC